MPHISSNKKYISLNIKKKKIVVFEMALGVAGPPLTGQTIFFFKKIDLAVY
jgi:hypothetical protein